LRPRGILIRDCADFPPLDGRYLRLAVRSTGENQRLLQALSELLG
jgi:threonine-phosphate decarboxylase